MGWPILRQLLEGRAYVFPSQSVRELMEVEGSGVVPRVARRTQTVSSRLVINAKAHRLICTLAQYLWNRCSDMQF